MNFKDITTYEQICSAIKADVNALPIVDHLPKEEAKDTINSFKYKRMVRAMNIQPDGTIWEPNFNDRKESKITPWLEVEADKQRPGGFGFSDSAYEDWDADASAGARRTFQTPERFRHALKHFPDLFLHEYLIIRE